MKTDVQLLAWYWLLASQTPLQVLYPSHGTTLSRSPTPSCQQARLIRDSPRSLVERREEPQEGSKVVPCAQRAAYPLHRVACREQRCCRLTRCASPLPRLHCAQTVRAYVSQDICSAPSSGARRPTREPAVVVHGAGVRGLAQEPAVVVHEAGAGRPTLAVENSYAVYQGAMRQQILGLHTPPCHRRMVITTLSSMFCLAALQHRPAQCQLLSRMRHSRRLSNVLCLSGCLGHLAPTTLP